MTIAEWLTALHGSIQWSDFPIHSTYLLNHLTVQVCLLLAIHPRHVSFMDLRLPTSILSQLLLVLFLLIFKAIIK